MSLTPGYYRFFIDAGWLESHAASFLAFLFTSRLLPVRVETDYCQRGQNYVVQYGDHPPKDTLIRDVDLIWHHAECTFSICPKRKSAERLTPAETLVLDVARRVAYQSGADLTTVQRNLTDLLGAVEELDPE